MPFSLRPDGRWSVRSGPAFFQRRPAVQSEYGVPVHSVSNGAVNERKRFRVAKTAKKPRSNRRKGGHIASHAPQRRCRASTRTRPRRGRGAEILVVGGRTTARRERKHAVLQLRTALREGARRPYTRPAPVSMGHFILTPFKRFFHTSFSRKTEPRGRVSERKHTARLGGKGRGKRTERHALPPLGEVIQWGRLKGHKYKSHSDGVLLASWGQLV